ncbi:MAG: DUF5009 domain-containing protein, partial [Cyclobacteriaceae bacterium]|nr:DUF5009 domain-containing protein [Cyclobacteriaceae bacterium]
MEPANTNTLSKRLLSIDALRGFDMLMISGGGAVIASLEGKTEIGFLNMLGEQFHHPEWNGFTFYDFIFPLFLFIAGVSLPFSLNKGLSLGLTKKDLYKKAFKRMLLLICIGIIFKNAPVPFFEWSQIRLGSVLGRIGFAGFVTTVIYLNFDIRGRLFWVGGILLGYYASLMLIPVPGYGAGDLSFEGNLVGWIDRTFLPGRLLQKTYDELGLFTQFPALCLTVLGSLAGEVLRNEDFDARKKLMYLVIAGITGIVIGQLWGIFFPVNKHLWTSSFILFTGGMAFLSIALFYWIIDVKGYRKWAFFFQVIGVNSLTIYLASRFISFRNTSELLFGGLYDPLDEKWHSFFHSVGALGLVWLFLYFLYKNKL